MLKNITSLLVCLFLVLSTHAQADNAAVTKRFQEYNNRILTGDFEGAMNYTMDEIFKIVPRETMITATKMIFNLQGMDTKLFPPEVTKVNEAFKEAGAYYCILEYKSWIQIRLKMEGKDTTDLKEDPNVTGSFQKAFGQDAVVYDPKTGFYTVTQYKRALSKAIDGKTWKFLVLEEKQKALLEKILPAPVMGRLFTAKAAPGH